MRGLTVLVSAVRQLRVLSPAKLWVGQGGRSKTLKFDLRVEVLVNGNVVATEQLSDVSAGGATFRKAVLEIVSLTLGAPTAARPGAGLSIRASVRVSCSTPSTGVSGTARLWYNGLLIDTGRRKDASSRFAATIGGTKQQLLPAAGVCPRHERRHVSPVHRRRCEQQCGLPGATPHAVRNLEHHASVTASMYLSAHA